MLWAVLILFFDKKVEPKYQSRKGKYLLIAAITFEVLRTVISQFKNNKFLQSTYTTGFIAVILLLIAILVTRFILKIRFADIGIKPINRWNHYEKIYILSIALLGILIFYFLTHSQFQNSLTQKGWAGLFVSFIIFLCWGFYQEWIYRGFIQTEFTRRFNAVTATLLANLLFTLGPLHFHQLLEGEYKLIAATFLIGLIFGILYHRSYNLIIPGILHGIGTWFLVGLAL